MALFRRWAAYLQDPEKVARFQRLCGVEPALEEAQEKSASDVLLVNGSCLATPENGEGDRRYRLRSARDAGEKGEGWHSNGMKNGVVPGEAAESQQGPAEDGKQHSWGMKRQPRRNSLTGESVCQAFRIRSRFLYYLFTLGTELGNELFYILFFPFCIWNVDAWMGRRLIIVWVWVMYLGQCTKDVIRWPRPASPPVVKLEIFYNSEYSMPSTHAMSGTAIPLTLVLLSYGRWQYPVLYGLLLAFCWCSLVCFSRIYMGMHSVLDVIAGFLYAILILAVFLPAVDLVDNFNLTHKYAPLIIISLHLALGIFSFTLDTWSTSRGDTAQILGCGAGVACGSHVNYLLSLMPDPSPEALPLPVPSLTVTVLGKAMLRLLIGVVILLLTKTAI
ncbi:PREDICTED: sphingosine-1-phosphate phosphatase 1 [Gekko japonicus]|uniref:Sphingosine-1-phosphate phosphatase 1 n=1 Tax=Gekko japonicus TaxID=146911 RepID=A0ABM1L1K0_GEKJA|nr:PREDICTED: sphingosine-1-phosphate phosphatase 1 [Gekko japonicus]